MKKELTARERVIAVFVFILWSLGIVFFPSMPIDTAAQLGYLMYLFYLVLHVVIFVLALLQLRTLYTLLRSKGKAGAAVIWRVALYVYVLIALLVSFTLSVQTLLAH